MSAAHALLSASGAERWLNCTPSARLEEREADTSSPYAQEGTLAHELGEIMLRRATKEITKQKYGALLKTIRSHEMYYKGMEDEVEEYTEYVLERMNELRTQSDCDVILGIEERLDYSNCVPGGFGTGDAVIVSENAIEVVDLKFGKGVEVDPTNNPQLMLYAYGAYERYGFVYDITDVYMTVAQVRLGGISTWHITKNMLLDWVGSIKDRANLAFEGRGEINPGPWCTFCKIRKKCKKRAETNLKDYKKFNTDPNLLSLTDIAEILGKIGDIDKWAKEIKDYAFEMALKGHTPTGYKLVEGRSNRVIKDQDKLVSILKNEGWSEDKLYKPKTIQGITALEKLIGKKDFKTLAGDLISKPPGKPTLVPKDDKREELNSVEDDFF